MKQNRDVTVRLRCSEAEKEALDFLASATGMNISEVMRALIRLGSELATAEVVKQGLNGTEGRPVQLRITAADGVDRFLLFLLSLYEELDNAGREDLAKDVITTILGHWFASDHAAGQMSSMKDAILLIRNWAKGGGGDDQK